MLYRSAVPRVYRALLATIRDPSAAEDALHDAFIEGLRSPPRHGENIPAWLFRVALRKAGRKRWPFLALEGHENRASGSDEIAALLDRPSSTGTSLARSRIVEERCSARLEPRACGGSSGASTPVQSLDSRERSFRVD